MAALLDCSTCGALMPAGRRCCPHCHCTYSPWKRVLLVASAALGLGAASCDSTSPPTIVEYGIAIFPDGGDDASVADLSNAVDAGNADLDTDDAGN